MSDLRPAAYVMLGMLRIGSRSGYEIRRSAELSLRFFWAVSPRQIYAELAELEQRGLVEGSDDPRGSMPRRTFTLTPAGEEALRRWTADPEVGAFEWRDLGLLKLFFSDVLDDEGRLELVATLRRRAERVREHVETVVLPASDRTRERHGAEMPPVVARFGAEFWAFMADWCDRLEAELRDA